MRSRHRITLKGSISSSKRAQKYPRKTKLTLIISCRMGLLKATTGLWGPRRGVARAPIGTQGVRIWLIASWTGAMM